MSATNEIRLNPDSYIFIEGDEKVENIFIIKSGTVRIDRSNKKLKDIRKEAGPGDILGFVSAAGRHPRLETAITKTETTVLVFQSENFIKLMQKNQQIAMKVISGLSSELRIYNQYVTYGDQITDLLPNEDRLFKLGKHYLTKEKKDYSYYILSRYLFHYPGGKKIADAKELLLTISKSGINTVNEPVKEGNYEIFSDNQVIFCEFEPGDHLYIIKEGKVKIIKNQKNSEMILSILNEGDIFGELAIVSNKPRNATAISYGESKLYPVNENLLTQLLDKSPEITRKIFMSLGQRIWFTFIRIEAKLYQKPITRVYAYIENKLMENSISLSSGISHTLNFGIEELFTMLNLVQETEADTITLLLDDPNLQFNFGQIIINDSSKLSAKSKYYKARDHITEYVEEVELISDAAESEPEMRDVIQPVKKIKTTGITPVAKEKIKKVEVVESQESVESEEPSQTETKDIEILIDKLNDEKPRNRNTAARRLGQFEEKADAAVPRLSELLDDNDMDVRITAMKSIIDILSHENAVSFFSRYINDKSLLKRCAAAKGLGELGSGGSERIMMLLINMLNDMHADVRLNAASSLGRMGEDAHDSVPLLINLLKDDDDHVRKAAVDALSMTAPDGTHTSLAVIALKDFKKSAKETVMRIKLKNILKKLSKEDKKKKKKEKE